MEGTRSLGNGEEEMRQNRQLVIFVFVRFWSTWLELKPALQ